MIHILHADRQRLRILNQVTIPRPAVRDKLQTRASDTEKGVALKIVAVAADSADGIVGAPLVALAVREHERELVHGRAIAVAVRELGRDRPAVWPAERLGLHGPDLGVRFCGCSSIVLRCRICGPASIRISAAVCALRASLPRVRMRRSLDPSSPVTAGG